MKKIILLVFLSFGFNSYLQTVNKEQLKLVSSVEGIKEYHLKNGLQVLLYKDPTQSNVVVNIVYHVGSRHEGYGEKGMAHLLEHMLFKSTKRLGDIKKMLSEKGGNANGTTWYDRTNYFEIFPSNDENLRWAIDMEADRMVNSTLLKKDLDTEFSVVRNEFEIGESQPSRVLMERLLSTAYLWHNYGNSTIGSKEDIERVDVESLRKFYKKYYQPDNATLIINGNFDEEKALQYVKNYFSIIPKPERVLPKTYSVEPPQDGERSVVLRRAGDAQMIAAIYHGAAYADTDYPAIDLLLEILKSDPSGYLYKSLIDTKIGSGLWAFSPALRDPGFIYLNLDVPKDKNIGEVQTVFLKELDKIKDLNYTEVDLERGRSKLLKQIEDVKNNSLYFSIGLTEKVGAGDYRLWFLYRDLVEKLTLNDIKRVAEKYFKPSNRTYGVFIPTNDFERVKPNQISDSLIHVLTKNYKGREITEDLVAFEPTIANLSKNTTEGQLANGLKYSITRKTLKGGKVTVSMRIPVGNLDLLKGKQFIADLMSSMFLNGTKTMNKEQIQDFLDKKKSSVFFYWFGQSLFGEVETYQENFDEVMDLISQMLTESVFPENELEKLKLDNKTQLEAQLNDPINLAFNKVDKKKEPYEKDHVYYNASPQEAIDGQDKVTRDEIVQFHKKFIGGNHAIFNILGNLETSFVTETLKKYFEKWSNDTPYERILPQHHEVDAYREIINTPDKQNAAVQCALNLSLNEDSPDYPALLMANEILGSGGFLTARIPTRLREKEGISYGAGSFLSVPIDNLNANWGAYAFFNPKFRDKVEQALLEEINRAVKDGFTQEEFQNSLTAWNNSQKTALGNDNFLLNLVQSKLFFNKPLDKFDELGVKVNALTLEQVNAALKKYISADKLILVFAGTFE